MRPLLLAGCYFLLPRLFLHYFCQYYYCICCISIAATAATALTVATAGATTELLPLRLFWHCYSLFNNYCNWNHFCYRILFGTRGKFLKHSCSIWDTNLSRIWTYCHPSMQEKVTHRQDTSFHPSEVRHYVRPCWGCSFDILWYDSRIFKASPCSDGERMWFNFGTESSEMQWAWRLQERVRRSLSLTQVFWGSAGMLRVCLRMLMLALRIRHRTSMDIIGRCQVGHSMHGRAWRAITRGGL